MSGRLKAAVILSSSLPLRSIALQNMLCFSSHSCQLRCRSQLRAYHLASHDCFTQLKLTNTPLEGSLKDANTWLMHLIHLAPSSTRKNPMLSHLVLSVILFLERLVPFCRTLSSLSSGGCEAKTWELGRIPSQSVQSPVPGVPHTWVQSGSLSSSFRELVFWVLFGLCWSFLGLDRCFRRCNRFTPPQTWSTSFLYFDT